MYNYHHLANFFICATGVSAALDLLDLASAPPLSMATGGTSFLYLLRMVLVCVKVAAAAAVAHLDERSGSGHQEFLMRGGA